MERTQRNRWLGSVLTVLSLATISASQTVTNAVQASDFLLRPYVQNVTQTSIVLSWETTEPTTCLLDYESGDTWLTLRTIKSRTVHKVELTHLKPHTQYSYTVTILPDGPDATGTFATAVHRDSPFVFGIYGNTVGNSEVNAAARDAFVRMNPQLVVHTGNLVRASTKDEWTEFLSTLNGKTPREGLLSNVPIYAVPGPTDLGRANATGSLIQTLRNSLELWRTLFTFPRTGPVGTYAFSDRVDCSFDGRSYSFKYGVAKFIVLDTGSQIDPDIVRQVSVLAPDLSPGSSQYLWLERELVDGKRSCAFTFVFMHNSPFASGEWYPTEPEEMLHLVDLFLDYDVTAVFTGSIPRYERSLYVKEETGKQLNFITAGGAGAPLSSPPEDIRKSNPYYKTHYGGGDTDQFSVISVAIGKDKDIPGKWWVTVSPTKIVENDGEVFDEIIMPGIDPLANIVFDTTTDSVERTDTKQESEGKPTLPAHLQEKVDNFRAAYGAENGDESYDPQFDYNKDGKIDFSDLSGFSARFPSLTDTKTEAEQISNSSKDSD